MATRSSRTRAAEAVAERWNELGIRFVVAHGLEGYPSTLGRDLDILMDQFDAGQALDEARRVVESSGWPITVCPPPLWGKRLLALAPAADGRYEYLELHTIGRFDWLLLPLVERTMLVTSWVGPFPTNAWTSLVKGIIIPLVGGETVKFTRSYLESTWYGLRGVEQEVEARLTDLLGARLAKEILTAARDADTHRLIALRSKVRFRCLQRMASRPATSATRVWALLRRKLGRLFSDSGARVRLCVPRQLNGLDLAKEAISRLSHIFVVTRIEPPRRRLGRLTQRAKILSRQGLILEIAHEPSSEQVTVTLLKRGHKACMSKSFAADVSPERLAAWIVEEWALSFPCKGIGSDASRPEAEGI